MLTRMTEDDWVVVLKVFAAAQSRCGQPGQIAMRCEKTAESFAAFVAFACGLILVKSVHRA
jgi:hypothetical protein